MQPVQVLHFPSGRIEEEAALQLAGFLEMAIQIDKIFLLLSGGSGIQVYQKLFLKLKDLKTDLSRLVVSELDDRFLPSGSPDSNRFQIEEAGIPEIIRELGGTWLPYPQDIGTGQATAEKISQEFVKILADASLVIFAGIGENLHTAGLMPTEDAKLFSTQAPVIFCEYPSWVDKFPQRLTATPWLIRQARQIVLYAVGEKKKLALQKFVAGKENSLTNPSLFLRESHAPVVLLSDQTL